MCRLLLPVPIKELGAIATALGVIARKDGKDARMRQVGNVLEIFTVPNGESSDRPSTKENRKMKTQHQDQPDNGGKPEAKGGSAATIG